MQLQSIENTIIIPDDRQTNIASFIFVRELLTMTLAEQNDEVIIESHKFLSNQGGIETTGVLKVEISCGDVVKTVGKRILTLSGTVENDQGQEEMFTLYFFMWSDRYITTSIENRHKETLSTNSIRMQFEQTSVQLLDSVFNLNLYRRDPYGHQYLLGYGRGYLVFGNRA